MKKYIRTFTALAMLTGAAVGTLPVRAQELDISQVSDEVFAEAVDIALNEATHTLYHEIGHMLVSSLELPIFGKEEDAVDNLATVLLIEQNSERADQILSDTIYTFFASARAETEEPAYYDEHSLDSQRGYQIVCMMVGTDPDYYSELADMVDLPPERRETCEADSDVTFGSWLGVIDEFAPTAENPAGKVMIAYEDAGADFIGIKQMLEERQVLELAKETLQSKIAAPIDISMVARECGMDNAWWDAEAREIVLCYELIDYIATVSALDLAQE